MHAVLALLLLALGACGRPGAGGEPEPPPNVLFIAVDDLRPALGCYGDERARTPSIDRLAASGALFARAYCVQSHCAPSRASVLTGRRPQTTDVGDIHAEYRSMRSGARTLPELFRRAGYATVSLGKVEHRDDDAAAGRAWSEPPWRPERWQEHYADPETLARLAEAQRELALEGARATQLRARFAAWESADVSDDEYADGRIATRAVAELERLRGRPFFLAVGFLKPHLPFVAPRRYWELHPEDGLAPDPLASLPPGAPEYAGQPSGELRSFHDVPDEGPIEGELARRLVRGYYACASYVDAQVGRVLDALDELGLAENTIVVLWSDHGYHLGDLGMWGKHTNYERAVRVPLLVRAPGTTPAGLRVEQPVELIDLYPTLLDLCGLRAPEPVEGRSLASDLRGEPGAPDRAAFHAYPARGDTGGIVGYAIRTGQHRLVEWLAPDGELRASELYDYADGGEASNLSGREELRELQAGLSRRVRAKWGLGAAEDGDGDGR